MKNCRICSLVLVIFACILIYACSPVLVPLKGHYVPGSKETVSILPADSIWIHIEQLFATHGLSVNKVDKSKGIITTAKTDFIPLYTFENERGQLQEAQAWVALPKALVKEKLWKPKSIYSQWHIQFSKLARGTTSIKVDSTVLCTYYPNFFVQLETHGRSTGKFEELLRSSLASQP